MAVVEQVPRTTVGSRVSTDVLVYAAITLREARRARNRERGDRTGSLRCECGRPDCKATVPAAADAHRGRRERFIVVPTHRGVDTVVGAADRFFLVV